MGPQDTAARGGPPTEHNGSMCVSPILFESVHARQVIANPRVQRACPIGSISASPMACPLRGHGRAGTQNDRGGNFEYQHGCTDA